MPVSTADTITYRMVQMTRLARIPMGMSRCGFFASWAAVEMASKPMYAKKMTPEAAMTPLQPKAPKCPAFGGMNGCQLAVLMKLTPNTMNSTTTVTLMATITELKAADCLMPM